jgi:hypothetical protein
MAGRMIQAKINLLPQNAGGRTLPVYSGYRGILRFDGIAANIDGELQFDAERLALGESGVCCVWMWMWQEGVFDLSVNQGFEIHEGPSVIGYGSILDPCGCALRPRESPGEPERL